MLHAGKIHTNPGPPGDRDEVLIRARNLKMARSAHAYVRGSTTKFYEWLKAGQGTLPAGPSIWLKISRPTSRTRR